MPLSWARKPGSGDYSWSTDMHCPGFVTVLIAFSCLTLVRHGRLVMDLLINPLHFCGSALDRILGIIPNMAKIFILLKVKCISL